MFRLSKIKEIEGKYPVLDDDIIINRPVIGIRSAIKPQVSRKAANIIVNLLLRERNNPRKHPNFDKLYDKLIIKYNIYTSYWSKHIGPKLCIMKPDDFDGDIIDIQDLRNPSIGTTPELVAIGPGHGAGKCEIMNGMDHEVDLLPNFVIKQDIAMQDICKLAQRNAMNESLIPIPVPFISSKIFILDSVINSLKDDEEYQRMSQVYENFKSLLGEQEKLNIV